MKRNVVQSSSSLIFTLLVVAILVVVNMISVKRHKVVDMTEEGVYTLTPQTRKALASAEDGLNIYAFVSPEERDAAMDLLDLYDYESDKLSVKIIDPDKEPALARKYNVQKYGTYVVEAVSGRKEVVEELTEEKITNAIIKVSTEEQKNVYVLKGHEERSLEDDNPLGWSGVKQALEAAAYNVKPLDWFATGEIPEDVDLLLIPGPRNDFQDKELETLKAGLDKGLSALITVDPGELPRFEKFLEGYGFHVRDDMILDPLSQQLGFDALVTTVSAYGDHPVAAEMRAATFFPVARSMELKNTPGKSLTALASTNDQSWGETDVSSIENGHPAFSKGDDLPGPRVIAASAEWEAGPPPEERKIGEKVENTRLIVVGDSDFASNSTLGFSGNRDLFMNMVGWLLEQEDRVSIRPKSRGFNPIMFTAAQLKTIFWTVVVGIPAAVMIFGVTVRFFRRRA